ncbi:CueP family metal-binding protein [Tessaracoccus terricola]
MKNRFAALAAAALATTLTLTACAVTEPQSPNTAEHSTSATSFGTDTDAFLAAHGLAGLDVTQIIERLDTTPLADRSTELMVSIRPNEVVFADTSSEVALPMPEDSFYLSFAPYVSQTHDCHFHSLTTCTGELQSADVHVTVTDNQTGETVVDESTTTYANGFLGLWLPRDLDATLTVTSDGRSASAPISTAGTEDPTCLTTLQLV